MYYYTMYNFLTALLFKVGIKCENHSGAIILLKDLFGKKDMNRLISFAKTERIDKQYYVDFMLTKESTQDLLKKTEDFQVKMKLLIKELRAVERGELREKFIAMLK